MNFTRSVTPPSGQLNPSFHEFLHAIQKEAESVLSLPTDQESKEKTTQVANRFFTYLLENLQSFNGANPDVNTLVERLDPFKSAELKIKPLLKKIIKDFRIKTKKLIDISGEKVVPFSSSLAAFPLPLLDTTTKIAELTTQFLREERNDFSLRETLEMCCLLSSQTMETQATLLFNLYTIKHFVEDPQGFTEQLLDYTQEAEGLLPQSASQNNTMILRTLFQASSIQNDPFNLLSRIPPELFIWLQNGGPGEKELFQGYEQLAHQNYTEAFEFYKKAADLGNAQALVEIGNCYYTGNGVSAKDHDKAFEFFEKAADFGNPQAFVGMGICYYSGNGVQAQDYNKAFEFYKKATDLGNYQALVGMGNCYYTGNGVPAKDCNKTFELYKRAADLGDSQALVGMGNCYDSGIGVPKNHEEAFNHWLTAKNLGNIWGALNVAKCLTVGQGTQKDLTEAKAILLDLIPKNLPEASSFYNEHF